jgi:hypothetical protein
MQQSGSIDCRRNAFATVSSGASGDEFYLGTTDLAQHDSNGI